MLPPSPSLTRYLDDHSIVYDVILHRRDFTAQETAHDTHTPGHTFAKTVLLWVDGGYIMAVLPANHKVDLDHLREVFLTNDISLATEAEISELCPDCEVGAMPPFGNLYDLPVFVSSDLPADGAITFNAGNHTSVIRMAYTDFARLVEPRVIALSTLGEKEVAL